MKDPLHYIEKYSKKLCFECHSRMSLVLEQTSCRTLPFPNMSFFSLKSKYYRHLVREGRRIGVIHYTCKCGYTEKLELWKPYQQ